MLCRFDVVDYVFFTDCVFDLVFAYIGCMYYFEVVCKCGGKLTVTGGAIPCYVFVLDEGEDIGE